MSLNILPADTVVFFTPQDVIIISPLPDICANGPIDQPLHCANSPWNCCIRRGRRPRRPVDRSHKQDQVHVIWHDHIFIHGQTGDVVGRPDILIHDFSDFRQPDLRAAEGVGPYAGCVGQGIGSIGPCDGGQQALLVMGADGDEVSTGGGIVKCLQSRIFADRQFLRGAPLRGGMAYQCR